MFKKATKTCTSAAVVSLYLLFSTPSTSSAMKTPENTEEDQNWRSYQNGILLSLVVQPKYRSSNKELPVRT
jgi:hypothetical protein